jgi:hypothetical protein
MNHVTIFDTTLCGDWAGNVWSSANQGGQASSCQTLTGYSTCAAYVQAQGGSFSEACECLLIFKEASTHRSALDWEVKSVKLYQQ